MDESKPINFVELLLADDIGTSAWNWGKKEPKSGVYLIPVITKNNHLTTDYSPMFLFKMAPGESLGLGERVQVKLKAGIFNYQGAVAVYLLFLFPGINFIHEVWINHYTNLDDTPSPLLQLQQMEVLSLLLYETSYQPERVIKIVNCLDWASVIANVKKVSPWSDAQFDAAKAAAPSANVLWNLSN